jgi:rubrerythrin
MDRRSLLEAFRMAIDKEEEARKFYTELAERADDPAMKQLLQRFASDERGHAQSLQDLYRTLRDTVPEV